MRDDESDKADDARECHSGGCCQRGGDQQNPFCARDVEPELLGLVIAELQDVERMTAEEQDADADEEVGKHGEDGGPVVLGGAAE